MVPAAAATARIPRVPSRSRLPAKTMLLANASAASAAVRPIATVPRPIPPRRPPRPIRPPQRRVVGAIYLDLLKGGAASGELYSDPAQAVDSDQLGALFGSALLAIANQGDQRPHRLGAGGRTGPTRISGRLCLSASTQCRGSGPRPPAPREPRQPRPFLSNSY